MCMQRIGSAAATATDALLRGGQPWPPAAALDICTLTVQMCIWACTPSGAKPAEEFCGAPNLRRSAEARARSQRALQERLAALLADGGPVAAAAAVAPPAGLLRCAQACCHLAGVQKPFAGEQQVQLVLRALNQFLGAGGGGSAVGPFTAGSLDTAAGKIRLYMQVCGALMHELES